MWLHLVSALKPDVLVLDDFGLKPLVPPGPEDLYEIIAEPHERGSFLLISNPAPEEWPDLLGWPLPAAAVLDRLTHQAHVVVITGTSFRAHSTTKEAAIKPAQS